VLKQLRTTAVLAVAVAAAFALAGCDPDGGTKAGGGPGVIAPGKPGEDASTLSAAEAAKAHPDDTPNQADIGYVTRMVEHHQRALLMSGLAAKRAESKWLKGLADRISASQGPEITTMSAWLKANGGMAEHSAHEHGAMPGMATDQQIAELRATRGAAFDRLFLKLMITHHQGAVTMATDVLSAGNNIQVEEWATEVIAQQISEIARMRGLR
jgi:uncharacterized protein (DUF305 family)